jgi:putative ABC transport system permease protein
VLVAIAYRGAGRYAGEIDLIGAGTRQIRKIVLVEALLLGVFGSVGGRALGFVLSLLLIYVINRQSFGWTVLLSIPYDFLWQSSLAT